MLRPANPQPRAMVRPALARPCPTAHQPQLTNRVKGNSTSTSHFIIRYSLFIIRYSLFVIRLIIC